MSWTFLDFVDENGVNQIKAWADSLPPRVKAKFNKRVGMLQLLEVLEEPYTTILTGRDCDGLMEVKFQWGGVQYRPLACYGPGHREVTLLIGATKRGRRFEPGKACAIARQRCEAAHNNRERVQAHDFS